MAWISLHTSSAPDLSGVDDNKPCSVYVDDDGNLRVAVSSGSVGPAAGAVFPVVIANPASVARGSQTATGSAVALAVGATGYTGGVDIWNSDTVNHVVVGTNTPTDAAGAGQVTLGPGQGYHEPSGDLSLIKIIASAGSPIVNWVASTR